MGEITILEINHNYNGHLARVCGDYRPPQMQGYQEFMNVLMEMLPHMPKGRFIFNPNVGIMADVIFMNNAELHIVATRVQNRIAYILNGNTYDREGAVRVLADFKHNIEQTYKKSNERMSAKELYARLTQCCHPTNDGGLVVGGRASESGSDDMWSRYGEVLYAHYKGNRLKFTHTIYDETESYNRTRETTKYYPSEITIKEIIDFCARYGKALPLYEG